jgi:hypothetical protein
MPRTITLADYLLETLNRRARERGEDVAYPALARICRCVRVRDQRWRGRALCFDEPHSTKSVRAHAGLWCCGMVWAFSVLL